MSTELSSTSEYVTKQAHEERFSLATYAGTRFKVKTESFKPPESITVPLPDTRIPRRWTTLKPEIVYLPAAVTELPDKEDTSGKTAFNFGILGGVLVVVLFWAIVAGILVKNKLHKRNQRMRSREPPSYSVTQFSSNSTSTLNFPNPAVELNDRSTSTVLDIESAVDNNAPFAFYQPSAPPSQTPAGTCAIEQPPSYTELHKGNSHILQRPNTKNEDLPPSYVEAQLHWSMQQGRR